MNRSGNRPSHEGCPEEVDRALTVCLQGGFRRVLLRGDTDFTQTKHLDRWSDDPRVRFIFGMDCTPKLHVLADDLPKQAWKALVRPARYQVKTQPRRPAEERQGQRIVDEREFQNLRLTGEEVAEFDVPAHGLPEDLSHGRGSQEPRRGAGPVAAVRRLSLLLLHHQRLGELRRRRSCFSANDRCNQENLHAQLKGGVRALHAPVDNLVSNWAYMVMTALAWNLKAW